MKSKNKINTRVRLLVAAICMITSVIVSIHAAYASESVETITDVDITSKLILSGEAEYNESDNSVLICPAQDWSNGTAKYPFEILENFEVSFDFKIGGGSGADGIVFAFYAEKDSIVNDGEYLNFEGCGGYGLEFDTYHNSGDSSNPHIALIRDKTNNHLISVDDERVRDNKWHSIYVSVNNNNFLVTLDGDIIINENVDFDTTYRYFYFAATTGASNDNHYIRNVHFTGRAAYSGASEWAVDELDKAEEYNLIPQILKGSDMTERINREEFAALAVKLYEAISGETALPAENNPFTDTDETETLKAYRLGITKGVTKTTFCPDVKIPREQVAVMLTRTICAAVPDTDITDGASTKLFNDDALISDYARESVYFMAGHNILLGTDGNNFAPRNTTTAEEAAMYANTTREQALAIAVRSYENIQ